MKNSAHVAKTSLLLCTLAFATLAFSQTVISGTCSFQSLNLPGNLISAGQGINDAGAVVGTLTENPHSAPRGFLLFGGKLTLFRFPGSSTTDANDINNHAQIVGMYRDSTSEQLAHGFIVHSGGFEAIDVPGAVNGTRGSGINNLGDIVGTFFDAANHSHGFLLHDGHFATFSFPGATNTQANGINDHSVIVGTYDAGNPNNPTSHGFKWNNGVFTTIDFPGAVSTTLNRINNAGKIVGSYAMCCGQHGFSLANHKFTTIDDPAPNTTSTEIRGVNKFDQIVGASSTPLSFDPSGLAFQASCR